MKNLLRILAVYKHILTRQELLTIRGQIMAGDRAAAMKGIQKCLAKHGYRGICHAKQTQASV